MRLYKTIIASILMLTLVGCAKSPQQIGFEPLINEAAVLSGTSAITLTVVDGRSDDIIGTRGGAYEESSLIRLEKNALVNVQSYVEKELEKAGFGITSDGDVSMELILVNLDYEVEEINKVKNNLKVACGIKLMVTSANAKFENSYSARTSMEVVGLASDLKNSEVINKALNLTINSMFRDQTLNDFLD